MGEDERIRESEMIEFILSQLNEGYLDLSDIADEEEIGFLKKIVTDYAMENDIDLDNL